MSGNKGEKREKIPTTPQNIPPDVAECLCQNGGVEGLLDLVMSPEMILKNTEIFKALSDPFRVKILSLLSIQPLCVCIIREFLDISDTRLSYHLKKLNNSGLISGNPQGNWIIYKITERGSLALSLCFDHQEIEDMSD
ncbi:MAG TPA: metalloregulator ArsR/SmtB family transcription factor [Methanospirillum sp.]|nr:metalloregulator ArsR/SmtB family transcription factor [Methanospirillum sp.]